MNRRSGRFGRTFVALCVGLLAMALSSCSLANGLGGNSGQSVSGDGSQTDVLAIKVGECLNATTAGATVASVPVIDCSKPHDTEAFASILMTDDSFPGATAVDARGNQECTRAFQGFVGIAAEDSTSIKYAFYSPTSSTWQGGDREILCLVYSVDRAGKIKKTTGSLEGAGV